MTLLVAGLTEQNPDLRAWARPVRFVLRQTRLWVIEEGFGMDWAEWTALFAMIIAVTTVACAFFFYYLWQATNESLRALRMSINIARESLNLSRQVFEVTTRPFLVFSDLRLHKNHQSSFSFRITMRNRGNGVAYQLTETVSMFLDRKRVRTAGTPFEVPLLPPQGYTPYELTVEGSDAEAVWNETKLFEVEARVDYSSATGQKYAKRDRWCWNAKARVLDLIESTEEIESVHLFGDSPVALNFPTARPARAEQERGEKLKVEGWDGGSQI
jgi:hypothetical protein